MPQAVPSREVERLRAMARSAGVPVCQILGGPTRSKVRVLTPLPSSSAIASLWNAGARAFAVPLPPPGPSRQFVSSVVRRLEDLRKSAGDSADFVLDCRASLTPAQAAQIARALEGFHLLWMDETCPPAPVSALRKIADESVTPLGFGGSLTRMRDLLAAGVAGILRPDMDVLGIAATRKIAALAETYYVAVAPRSNDDALAVQIAASLPNSFIHESATLPLKDGYLEVRS
jgi:galactonate dehydratase